MGVLAPDKIVGRIKWHATQFRELPGFPRVELKQKDEEQNNCRLQTTQMASLRK